MPQAFWGEPSINAWGTNCYIKGTKCHFSKGDRGRGESQGKDLETLFFRAEMTEKNSRRKGMSSWGHSTASETSEIVGSWF